MKRIIAKILIVAVAFSATVIPVDVSEAYTGYTKIGKHYYYFDYMGRMQKYSQTINGKPYYFYGSGRAADKKWITFKDGSKSYCLGQGKLATGYKKIGKHYYYFDNNGVMQKYGQIIKGKPYYFHGSGKAAKKKWITFKDKSKRYCLGKGKLATGYRKVGKYYYYFDPNGVMQKYSQTIKGKPYYFYGSGKAAKKKWITFKSGTKKYCLGNGKLATGYRKIGKHYYYFNSSGEMQKYSQTINGKPYYFYGSGKAAGKKWITFKDGSKKYCLGNGKLATGQVKISGKNYVFDYNGCLMKQYVVDRVPDKKATEYTFANKNYKGYCQYSRNYKGYNDYLASHGCGVTTLTNVLCTYIPGCNTWTPYETIEIAEKKVAGQSVFYANYNKSHTKQMPITLYGTTKVLNYYGIKNEYVSSFKSDSVIKKDIVSHLRNGYPVIFIISQLNRKTNKKTDKWTGSVHTMLMIGVDNKERNVLIINPAGSSRFQLVSIDEMINYMWSCSSKPNSFYWNGKSRCGGYIKIME